MTSKTFCFVSALYYPHLGGVERYTYQLSKKLVELGHKVLVLAANTEDVKPFEITDGISVYRLPVFRIAGSRYPILKPGRIYFSILKQIRKVPIDHFIINTRFYHTTLIGLKLARQRKIPAIVIEHGTGHFTVNNRVLDYLGCIYEECLTHCVKLFNPRFFGVSKACNEWLEKFNIKPTGVLYNGVDAHYVIKRNVNFKDQYNIPEHSTIITFAGRLIREKGIITFLEAAKKLLIQSSDIYFFIAGSGPLLDTIIKNNPFPENIFMLGALPYDAVMNLLQQSDILVNPTNYPEGLPTIVLEAGISRCAVIATSRGGTAELIQNDHFGILIKPGVEEDIVKAVTRLKENAAYLKEVTGNLYSVVSTKFNWDFLSLEFIRKLDELPA